MHDPQSSSEVQVRSKSKVEKACAQITNMALKLGAHAKLPTVHEMSERFSVSRGTIDMALRELEAQKVIYRLHAVGIFVSPHNRKKLCILRDPHNSHFDTSPFWHLIIEAQQQQANSFGFDTVVHDVIYDGLKDIECDTGEVYDFVGSGHPYPLPDSLVDDLQNGRVHGFLATVIANHVTRRIITDFPHVPLVSLSSNGHWRVTFDTDSLFEQAVSALFKRGCRNIGIWSELNPLYETGDDLSVALATSGFPFYVLRHGLKYKRELVQTYLRYSSLTYEQRGEYLAHKVFGRDRQNDILPEGVLIQRDAVALGAIKALETLGIEVGRDVYIAVQSNAGSPLLRGYDHHLIRFEYDLVEMANVMLELMENILTRARGHTRLVQVQPRLMAR